MKPYRSLRTFAATLPPEQLGELEDAARQPAEVHEHPPQTWVGCPGCVREQLALSLLLAELRLQAVKRRVS